MPDIVFDENYYKKIIKEFGYNPLRFEKINFNLGKIDKKELRARWICHSEGNKFSESLKQGKHVIVTTGIGLSAPPHVGTLAQIVNAIFLQGNGIPVQMVLGDLDAYNGKNISLQVTRDLAKKYREFILRLGFKIGNGSILRDQYNDLCVLRTIYLCGKYMNDSDFEWTEEDLHKFYVSKGRVDKDMTFRRKLSLALMTADFIYLFLSDRFEAVLVMLGIDEHKYVLFSQEVLERMKKDNMIKRGDLAAIYSHMNKGFNNYPKMSKSFPDSSINPEMSPAQIVHRIVYEEGEYKKANESPVYQMMSSVGNFSLKDLTKRYLACEAKSELWVKYKKAYAEMLVSIFKKWQEI